MDDEIELTRRRLLGGLVTAATASAAAGAGTMAYFSDTATSADNTVQAGTLSLEIDGAEPTATFLDIAGITPGEDHTDYEGPEPLILVNEGSVEGVLEIDVDEWSDAENEIVGNENGADNTDNEGELQNHLQVQAVVDDDPISDRHYVADLPQGYTLETGVTIDPQSSVEFSVRWWFVEPESGDADDAQSDSVEMDLTFRLVQSGGG